MLPHIFFLNEIDWLIFPLIISPENRIRYIVCLLNDTALTNCTELYFVQSFVFASTYEKFQVGKGRVLFLSSGPGPAMNVVQSD
jgi:hypothetical protein